MRELEDRQSRTAASSKKRLKGKHTHYATYVHGFWRLSLEMTSIVNIIIAGEMDDMDDMDEMDARERSLGL